MVRSFMMIALGLSALSASWAQGTVIEWSFEAGLNGWSSVDPAGRLDVTYDATIARVAGGGVAEYVHEAAVGKLGGIAVQLMVDTARAKSVRFWLRTSAPTLMLASLTEKDGSNYHAPFQSLANVWQDISLDLSDFRLGEDSQDENSLLDPGQINAIGLLDGTAFAAAIAAQVPFLVPPELGQRKLWFDDLALDTESVAPRWETAEVNGLKGVRLESFEGLPLQWLVMSPGATQVAYDDQVKADGDLSLRATYDVPAGKLMGLLTNPGAAPIAKALRLQLSLRSSAKTTLLIGLKEADESQYSFPLPVEAGEEHKTVDLPLAEFKLGDDSSDEDGKLTLAEVSELSVLDVSAILGQPVGKNTLWLDNILFLE